MSKRNRNKFRVRDSINRNANPNANINSSTSPVSVANQPITGSSVAAAQGSAHSAEYRIIGADLIRLVILNAIMLALVLVVYFTNLHSNYLERIFLTLFKI